MASIFVEKKKNNYFWHIFQGVLSEKSIEMKNLMLPPLTEGRPTPQLPNARQLTIVGAPGAGKTRFMEEMIRLSGDRAFCLSAISAPYPEMEDDLRPGSIDSQFRKAVADKPYMRTDAVSQLDKLVYMLFADEFDHLLSLKEKASSKKREKVKLPSTRLDRLATLWETVFPGNRIVRSGATLLFSTQSGDDLIGVRQLSQSEQTVLYYAAAVLYAMPDSIIFIDSPSLFLHPTILNSVWNAIEELRPDCRFVYNSVDVGFVSTRTRNVSVWVKSYDASLGTWDYEMIRPGEMHEEIFVDLIGSRRPVLFIEGDSAHSIDARLYPLVFPEWTVRPLGSCNRVIETTRTFREQRNLHHLESHGIVDRDRRTKSEVEYLRKKDILVAGVAEVENLFLLEGVVKAMARRRAKNPQTVFSRVKKCIIAEFSRMHHEQALQHVRHRVKRAVEYKVDMKFKCITAMEVHLKNLFKELDPRGQYGKLLAEFKGMIKHGDYDSILKVFNHKPMLAECGIAKELGYKNRDEYIAGVVATLKENSPEGKEIRRAIQKSFGFDTETKPKDNQPVENSSNKLTGDKNLGDKTGSPDHC